jgi:hypothetical protein
MDDRKPSYLVEVLPISEFLLEFPGDPAGHEHFFGFVREIKCRSKAIFYYGKPEDGLLFSSHFEQPAFSIPIILPLLYKVRMIGVDMLEKRSPKRLRFSEVKKDRIFCGELIGIRKDGRFHGGSPIGNGRQGEYFVLLRSNFDKPESGVLPQMFAANPDGSRRRWRR